MRCCEQNATKSGRFTCWSRRREAGNESHCGSMAPFLRQSTQPRRGPQGITLLELLTVVAVIGLLTALGAMLTSDSADRLEAVAGFRQRSDIPEAGRDERQSLFDLVEFADEQLYATACSASHAPSAAVRPAGFPPIRG